MTELRHFMAEHAPGIDAVCRWPHMPDDHVLYDGELGKITVGDLRELERDIDHMNQTLCERDAVLAEIAKGEGAFSRDPLTHAINTIESMKALALAALQPKPDGE